MKRTISIICSLVLIFSFFISEDANSQEPFPCDENFYQVFGPDGELVTYDLLSDTFVVAPINPGRQLNSVGYRLEDNFAYGVFQDNSNLARIGSDGTVVDLGPIAGFPGAPTAIGDFYSDGLLYVIPNAEFNTMYAINVETVSVEKVITIDGPNFFVSDIAYNPVDGLFYGVTQTSFVPGTEVPAAVLISIDVVAGTFETIGLTNLPPDVVVGSMYADASGFVYGSQNLGVGTPSFYRIDITSGSTIALGSTVSTGPIDGFSCRANAGPFARAVPTLSEWGLIAMAGIRGVAALIMLNRKRKITT